MLAYLEEIDELAKADSSYRNRSKTIRAREARSLVARLTTYSPPKKEKLPPKLEIEMAMKRAAGNIRGAIEIMRALEYEDWAIGQDFRRYLPAEFFEIMNLRRGDSPSHEEPFESKRDVGPQHGDHLHIVVDLAAESGMQKVNADLIRKGEEKNKVSSAPANSRLAAFDVSNGLLRSRDLGTGVTLTVNSDGSSLISGNGGAGLSKERLAELWREQIPLLWGYIEQRRPLADLLGGLPPSEPPLEVKGEYDRLLAAIRLLQHEAERPLSQILDEMDEVDLSKVN